MKRISSSGASAIELLITLVVIGLSLYYSVNVLMSDAAAPAGPGDFKKADLPAAAEIQVDGFNDRQQEQAKAIDEALGRKK